ncbi:TetR/AcrR family transcriptional regulator [Ktedonosporobacter rubrisoli]|nr:TetR/AcrR family transcriptional regulator C-terminal domain-containing protein [Ktedonosporobacter rubrisoli]
MSHTQEPVDLRVRRTHKLLWEALLALMGEREFETLTVKDICERAMVHRTTFYNHYEDKYDLLRCGMQETYEMLMAQSNRANEGASTYQVFFVHVASHKHLYRIMLCGQGGNDFQGWLRDRFMESLEAKMQQAEQAGKQWGAPLPLLAHFYAGAIVSMLAWWIVNDLPASVEQMAHYLQGLMVEPSSLQGEAR